MILAKMIKYLIVGLVTITGFLLITMAVATLGGLLWSLFAGIGWLAGSFAGTILKAIIYGGLSVIIIVMIGWIVKSI